MPASSYFDRYTNTSPTRRPAPNYFAAFGGPPKSTGLPIDPRMAASAAQAHAAGITGINYNAQPPWGHMGAPLDFHHWQNQQRGYGGGGGQAFPAGGYTPADHAYMAQSGDPNAGLRSGVAGLQALNAGVASRGPLPAYSPLHSPASATGAGLYAAALANPESHGMLPSDLGAQQVYAAHGYMPNRTVGGAWGHHAGEPNPQSFFDTAHPGYQPMHAAPLAMAPTTGAGYMEQMFAQNPGGRFFGGALPALGTSSGGSVRPMWMGPPQNSEGSGVTPQMQRDWAGRNGFYSNAQGTMSPLAGVQSGSTGFSPHDIRAMQVAGAGPNHVAAAAIPQADRYHNLGLLTPAERMLGVRQNAFNSSQARKARLGVGDPLDQAMRQNPMLAGMYGMAGLQHSAQMGQLGLGYAGLAQQSQQQHFDRWKELGTLAIQAHQAGHDDLAKMYSGLADHFLGSIGYRGGAAGSPGGGAPTAGGFSAAFGSPPQNASESVRRIDARVRAAVPQEKLGPIVAERDKSKRDQMISAAGVTDPQIRSRIHQQSNINRPGHDEFGVPSRKFGWPHAVNNWLDSWTGGGTWETPSGQRVRIVNGQMVPVGPSPGAAAPAQPSNSSGIPWWTWGL
ncbi:MAG TPA: hypothetical protein VGI40_05055 [Pirellulaceae bacterium]|jgi:hypothetical protein